MALISCPECGKQISDKASSCPHCGCSLGKPTLQVKESPRCSNCGFQLSEGVSYCPKCGAKVTLNKESLQKPVEESHKQESNKGCWWGCSIIFIILGIIGAITDESDGNDGSGKQETDNLVEKVVNVFSSDNKGNNGTDEEDENILETYTDKDNLETISKEKEHKQNEEISKHLGKYNYHYAIGGAYYNHAYFNITLKADGTFTHKANNEDTEQYVKLSSLVDGAEFPSGGKWYAINNDIIKGVYLDFNCNWGRGTLNFENGVLEIPHMNGYTIKVKTYKE